MENIIQAVIATGLCKTFGSGSSKIEVFKDLNFSLPAGAFHSIMGASGSGKSTFLHSIARLMSIDSGRIEIGGVCISEMDDNAATLFRRRNIGIVFQDFNLVPTLTAKENVELPILLDKSKPDKELFNTIIDALGIGSRLSHLPSELSGGERQRVAIARALLGSPAVLLADEPTGNLDSPAARSICKILRDVNTRFGTSILLVTHDPVVAATADRVNILRDGVFAEVFDTGNDPALVSEKYLMCMGRTIR